MGTALITGSPKRIGKEIALALAEKGFCIALHYHASKQAAEEVAKEVEKRGRSCSLFRCDFNSAKDVSALIPQVFQECPDCCLLINNASIFERARMLQSEENIFNRHFNINFKAPFFLTRDFARQCNKGSVINILDTKISGFPVEYFVYTLTKKMLFELTMMAAKELGPAIRVNAIAPGLILPSSDIDLESFKNMGQHIPLKRIGDVESVVSAIQFLVENQFVTGECIYVDGGEHLR